MTHRVAGSVLAIAVALAQSGCWAYHSGATGFVPRHLAHPLAKDAILRVNEAGIAWGGDGDLGVNVQEALLRAELFDHVYYPVEPPNPPDLVIEVVALGTWNYGLVLRLVVGPSSEDYGISCDVRVLQGNTLLREFHVESKSSVVHSEDADSMEFETVARQRVFRDLSDRIADGLAEPPSLADRIAGAVAHAQPSTQP